MKVQHLTTLSHNRDIRDTDIILPETREHFKFLEIKEGKILKDIPDTPLKIRATVTGDGVAAFDLIYGDTLLFVNICCFRGENKEPTMKYVDELARKMPVSSDTITPTEDLFIYTIAVMPLAPPNVIMLCGEIELYIFNALYMGFIK